MAQKDDRCQTEQDRCGFDDRETRNRCENQNEEKPDSCAETRNETQKPEKAGAHSLHKEKDYCCDPAERTAGREDLPEKCWQST